MRHTGRIGKGISAQAAHRTVSRYVSLSGQAVKRSLHTALLVLKIVNTTL